MKKSTKKNASAEPEVNATTETAEPERASKPSTANVKEFSGNGVLRAHAEQIFAHELAELKKTDKHRRPTNWNLSPWAVATYLLGGKLDNGFTVTPKYIGNSRLIEIAVATLTTDRGLLLYGLPGTAKSWVSEHLSAAISGDSTMLVPAVP